MVNDAKQIIHRAANCNCRRANPADPLDIWAARLGREPREIPPFRSLGSVVRAMVCRIARGKRAMRSLKDIRYAYLRTARMSGKRRQALRQEAKEAQERANRRTALRLAAMARGGR